jgi:alkylation response protein AidB-like acyl-CoA dehydrogenase
MSPEDDALARTFDALFTKWSDPLTVRRAEALGFDEQLWSRMVDAGATSMPLAWEGVPRATTLQLALVAERAGHHLAPVPLVETMVAARLLGTLHRDRLGGLLDRIGRGEIATVALRPARDGVASLVPAGAVASVVLAIDGDDLVLVESEPPRRSLRNFGGLAVADRAVRGEDRTLLARGRHASALHADALALWKTLTAAALVGLAARALSIGVDYAKTRIAFDVPIATFQTVAHRLADRATAVDGARLLAYEAAWAGDSDLDRAPSLSSMAFLFASETALDTTRDSLHFHGGYGFTAEYDIQLYFRRAKAWSLLLGDPACERQWLGRSLFVEEA